MRLTGVALQDEADACTLIGEIRRPAPAGDCQLYYRFSRQFRDFVAQDADAFAVAMLVPAMKSGEPLEILPPVSPRLHFELPRIRDIFCTWFGDLHRIPIETRADSARRGREPRRAASFFSGGVDSFHSLLRHVREPHLPIPLTHIIYMRGVETELNRIKGAEASQTNAENVAARLGLSCIVGETNLRVVLPLPWERLQFGTALASVGLSLSAGLDFVGIPSGYSYRDFRPDGSSPLVDERLSTEQTRILHDGADCTRARKTAAILRWERELVLEHLRVCGRNLGGAFNCGQCYKCVRTAVALDALGCLDEAALFVDRSPHNWERLARTDHLTFIEDNLALARECGARPALIRMLERVVRRRRARAALREFARNTRLRHLLWMAPQRWLR